MLRTKRNAPSSSSISSHKDDDDIKSDNANDLSISRQKKSIIIGKTNTTLTSVSTPKSVAKIWVVVVVVVALMFLFVSWLGASYKNAYGDNFYDDSLLVDDAPLSTTTTEEDRYWRKSTGVNHNSSHPHVGARHSNGTLGMIVDPSPTRIHPFLLPSPTTTTIDPPIPHSLLCPANSSRNIEGPHGHEVLLKIRGGIHRSLALLRLQSEAILLHGGPVPSEDTTSTLAVTPDRPPDDTDTDDSPTTTVRGRRSRILCLVYTVHSTDPASSPDHNLRAQASTWGRRCDGFLAASNFTDHSIGSVDLPHRGEEAYANMWQKLRSLWGYVYDHYLHEYDFFHVCGDDVYIVVDNLRAFVDGPQTMRLEDGHLDSISATRRYRPTAAKDAEKRPRPLLFGTPMPWKHCYVPAGGPGYLLNRAALRMLGEVGLESHLPDSVDPREDVFLGTFFCGQGVYLSDTSDRGKGFRYHEGAEKGYRFDGRGQWEYMRDDRGLGFNKGMDSVSAQTIGMHLKSELWSEETVRLKSRRKRKEKLRAWPRQKELLEFRREVGVNFTVTDMIYRYHAALYDLC